jgi:hypothetical protein
MSCIRGNGSILSGFDGTGPISTVRLNANDLRLNLSRSVHQSIALALPRRGGAESTGSHRSAVRPPDLQNEWTPPSSGVACRADGENDDHWP